MLRKIVLGVIAVVAVIVSSSKGYAWDGTIDAFTEPVQIEYSENPYPVFYSFTMPADWGIPEIKDPSKWDYFRMWVSIEYDNMAGFENRYASYGLWVYAQATTLLPPNIDGPLYMTYDVFDHRELFARHLAKRGDSTIYAWLEPQLFYRDAFTLIQSTLHVEYNPPVEVVQSSTAQPVPEPATMLLLGTGLTSLFAASRRKKVA